MKDKEFIDKYNNSSIEKLTGIGIQLLKNIHSYIYKEKISASTAIIRYNKSDLRYKKN